MSDATQHTTAVPTADAAGAPTDDASAGTPDAAAATNGVAELTPEALQRIYDWARDTFDEEAAEFFVTRLEAASPDQVRTIIAEALANHPTHDDLAEALEPYATEEETRAIVAEALANHPTHDDLAEALANHPTKKELRKTVRTEVRNEVNKALRDVPTRADLKAFPTREEFNAKFDSVTTKDDFNSLTWKLIRFSVGYSLALSSLVFAIARYL